MTQKSKHDYVYLYKFNNIKNIIIKKFDEHEKKFKVLSQEIYNNNKKIRRCNRTLYITQVMFGLSALILIFLLFNA